MRTRKTFIGGTLAAITAGVCAVLGISTISKGTVDAMHLHANPIAYTLTLDSTNKVSAAGDHDIYTAKGGKVAFTYSNVAANDGGHTKINEGGYVVNKDVIHSISQFTATFSGSGTLKARVAYVANDEKFSDYFELVSGYTVDLGTNPYYLEMKAFGGSVSLESANYVFSCEVNADAEEQDTSGEYTITFKDNGSDSSSEITSSSNIFDQVDSGAEYINSFSNFNKIFAGDGGLKLGSSKANGYMTINFKSTSVVNTITTVDISSAQYGTDSGNFKVYVNGSSSYTTITPSAGGTIQVNAALTTLEIETTVNRAYLLGLTLNYGSTVQPGTPTAPLYEVGFSADDTNKATYTTNSIFSNDNALSAYKIMSNGTHSALSSSEYSYVIKNSNNQIVSANEKFPAEGAYTLEVSYGNYIPVVINLTVGEYVYITDVTAAMTTVTFTTADTLSEHLAGNLTAHLEYSNDTESSSIAYVDFAANDIAVKLLTPKGITYDQTNPFGTAGTWTLKVYSIDDENMYYNISLTVNAIPVETITLDTTSKTMYPEDELQLVATVGPNTATNQVVDWTSSNENVATVDDNGLVTAVAIGTATITAAAVDGSNVYGTCSVTVVAKPAEPIYAKVTDATSLTAGDVILLTYESESVELIGFTTSGTIYGESTSYSTKPAGLYPLTVAAGNGTGNYSLKNGNNYLCWSSGNSLSTTTTLSNNSSWTFSGSATIANVADSERIIRYNTSSPRFACYTSANNQIKAITIYRQTNAAPVTPVYPTAINLTGESNSITIGQTSQLTVNYTPSDTNVKNATFTSSNTSVATVSTTGLITGVAQGNATITATAEAASGTVSNTFAVTVNPIAVTSVSLDTNSATVKEGKTVSLVATVYPTNATNKAVTWTSSNTAVATVNANGVVTGVSAGSSTITVTTTDGSKTASCVITVTSSVGEETFSITYTDLPTSYQTGTTVYTAASGIKFQAYNCANYSSKVQFRASSGYLQNTEELELQSITINDRESNELTVYGSNTAGSFSTAIEGTNDVYDLNGYSYFKVARTASGAAYCSSITVTTGTPTPTDPTSIILSSTSADVAVGATKQLSVSYVPSNANQNKDVTWTSSNTNVATVSADGLVSVKSTATAGQTTTITARLTNLTSIYATCTITVTEQTKDDHTVLIYMCGADLESGYASSNQGLATGDITEILNVTGQPDDVNIVIETGGAKKWSSTYGISSTKLERWHVSNRSLVKDASLTYANMGQTSTLQSFIEYGLNNYPAERTGLVFWNHGGAMRGVCYDEKSGDDSLLDTEIKSAVSGALSNCGMSGQKLEWVGYDACLMQVQDIASLNADYFNYMVASEESEAGEGWDYDTWVDDLYSKKTTPVILKAIVDGFIKDNGGTNSSSNDQTLSYLNLSYMSAYITAWNNMSTQLGTKLTSSNKSSFNTLVKSCKYYADSDYTYYGIFDAKDFINKLSANSTFNPGSTYTNAVLTAFGNLVEYSSCGKGAGNSNGLCLFWSCSSNCAKGTYYTADMTKFTAWRTLVTTYGL